MAKKNVLVTVTDSNFLPGSIVMIYSFLQQNPWFDGEIVVFADKIGSRKKQFFEIFDRVRFVRISPEIKAMTQKLIRRHTKYEVRFAQFYSLELFRLTEYDRLLFLDSDILVRRSFQELFDRPESFLACGDNFFYRDCVRDPETFGLIEPEQQDPNRNDYWADTFSAGMMLIDGAILRQNHHPDLVKMINHRHFRKMDTDHSDQLILNQYFRNQYSLVSSTYNFRFNTADRIEKRDGASLESAHAIHFTARKKPWNMFHVIRSVRALGNSYLKGYHWWNDCWLEVLERIDDAKFEIVK